jgi:ankyrin repeat protein
MKDINQLILNAVLDRDEALICNLIDEFSFDPWDDFILSEAIESHQLNVVRLLVERGFDLNHDCYSGNIYPIEMAIIKGYSCDEIQELIKLGANPNIASCASTPLICAAENNNEKMVDFLIGKNVNLNLRVEGGCTALISSANNGCVDITKRLVESGADPNILTIDDCPRVALVFAAEQGHREVFNYLFPLTHSEVQKKMATNYLKAHEQLE